MFIRRTTYRLKPDQAQGEFEREMRAHIRPDEINGLVSTAHVPNEDGSWTVVAVWHSKSEAMAATPRIRAYWDTLADQFSEPPVVSAGGVSVWETL